MTSTSVPNAFFNSGIVAILLRLRALARSSAWKDSVLMLLDVVLSPSLARRLLTKSDIAVHWANSRLNTMYIVHERDHSSMKRGSVSNRVETELRL